MWRAARLRCPRCGGEHILRDWFHLEDRCPSCGWEFERDEGFFLGAYMLNLCMIMSVLFVVCMTFLAVKLAWPSSSVFPALAAGVGAAVVVPIAFYPFSKTLWAAIEVGLGHDDPVAEAEAAIFAGSHQETATGEGQTRAGRHHTGSNHAGA